ncbi:dynein regulatory complex subunit 7 isoform X3 [Balaenoptera musculus]|uniref:Adhesion G protein-coupled receptor G3 n=1 Tax=Balaenoptera musculus TaxID=9771 RepID=A0A8B8VUE3_BALMU|nr:dynein regulatory complex subunit 7 isoform X3 [Balaenoptera musculus]
MVARGALGVLLLLHLASDQKNSATIHEESRQPCKGLINANRFDDFGLKDTAKCFSECARSGNESCNLGNLQRYWLNYEIHLAEESLTETVNMGFLTALVKNISTSISEDLHFSLTPSQVPKQVTEDEHQHPDRVRLPRSLFESFQGSRPMVRLAITILDVGSGNVFKGPRLSLGDGSSVLNNHVVGLSLGHINVTGLAEPLEITFSHQHQPPNVTLSCVFWDVTKGSLSSSPGSSGDWSSKGCSTEFGVNRTICRCDHLTFFALLLRPVLDQVTVKALTRISQAGCGTSMIFLAFTIVLYAVLRFSRQRFKFEDAPKIHVALSVSLFLLNLAFFINVGHGLKGSDAACWARGAVFHYFLLCAFTWMGLEAFHLYLLVIKVFNTYVGHYFLKLSLVGWGLPALIVIGTGSANSYGPYAIRDKKNTTTLELCWFCEKTATSALYVTVHGYFLITFLFSAVVLGLVALKIFTLSSATAGKEKGQHWKGVLTLLGLSSLVGVTWGLAILTPLGLSTTYVFALFTSLQETSSPDSQRHARMEVLKEKVEEEEEAERAERGEKMMRPMEVRKEETIMTQEMLRDLERKLSEIEVSIPEKPSTFTKDAIDISKLPLSYQSNTPKEEHLLQVADNFSRQYSHLCPDRVPLFLHPVNECEVPKFVSTTIRPTLMPYPELYNWDTCAQFVSDFLSAVPLPDPLKPPSYLYSSTTVLKYQKGNCFDFSTLLCSMLIGARYDAYCVYGYGSQDLCHLDLTREVCPLTVKPKEMVKEEEKAPPKKYAVKPPRDLTSRFEQEQEIKRQEAIKAEEERRLKQEEEHLVEQESAKTDPLHGLRVHSWVLVLSGKREVPESFFIDPFTGRSYSTQDDHFLGIESLWNHKNYWVNMQDCWNCCKDLVFDLGDPVRWEYLLLGTDKPLLSLTEEEDDGMNDDDDVENLGKEDEDKSFDMPCSWVEQIEISPEAFETRCPNGKKVIQYKRAKLEKWAPYLNNNGLVCRLTTYEDLECTKTLEVKEWFQNREDMLELKHINKVTGLNIDYFKPGHPQALRVHSYTSMQPEMDRIMEFYETARVDGLIKREETPRTMTEYYQGRPDLLSYRHVNFGPRIKKLALNSAESNPRPVVKITERFFRNPAKPADEDVAERVFLILDERIQLRYHCREDRITASKREFLWRTEGDSKGNKIIMTPDMCLSFEVEPMEHTKKLLYQPEAMMKLKNEEKLSRHQAWESELEVLEILKLREEEEAAHALTISIYDTKRNEKSKEYREAMERVMHEEHLWQVEAQLDYLAPFLAQLPPGEKLTRWQAMRLKDECLSDFKQRLIDKANLIQARFEKETQELQKQQQWYQENQVTLTPEDEDLYLSYCSQAMFRIRILEQRLNRHKELAPLKYLAMEEKLYKDPRLVELLKVFV